ncbi:MAG: hypothetical protein PHX50_14185 [Massilibacteroides sp.]|nr:hypothetical protein [Massilibacteroides sp.]
MKLKKIVNIFLAVFCIFMVGIAPAMAADGDYQVVRDSGNDNKDNVIEWQEWFNPVDGFNELESSPVGNPLKKFVNLVIGLVILYGAASILKSWFKSNSEDGEKASDGYLGMGSKAVGALVMIACVAMYFYFLGYKL